MIEVYQKTKYNHSFKRINNKKIPTEDIKNKSYDNINDKNFDILYENENQNIIISQPYKYLNTLLIELHKIKIENKELNILKEEMLNKYNNLNDVFKSINIENIIINNNDDDIMDDENIPKFNYLSKKRDKPFKTEIYLDLNNFNENYDNSIYNISDKYKNYFTIKDKCINCYLNGKKYIFVFFKDKYNIPKDIDRWYSFNVKLLKDCDSLAVGICIKKIVEKNNYTIGEYEYDLKEQRKNNLGYYIINTSQILYNCNNIFQCKNIFHNSLNKKDTIIQCNINPKSNELTFTVNYNTSYHFIDVRCFKYNYFSPCLIFNKNASIETTFNY